MVPFLHVKDCKNCVTVVQPIEQVSLQLKAACFGSRFCLNFANRKRQSHLQLLGPWSKYRHDGWV
jgi:hypothetical protein